MAAKFLQVVDLEEAKRILEKHWCPVPRAALVPLDEAFGSVLAEDVASPIDVPPFDRAAYDGFAVRASDTFGADGGQPRNLKLAGKVMAGTWLKKKINRKECVEITTGAPMPRGADAVVMAENATVENGTVLVRRAVSPSENVSERGSDIKSGKIVATKGKILNIRDIGAIAAVGVGRVRVISKPKVAIISTGSEILEPGSKLKPAKIYDSNGFTLSQAVKSCGCEAVRLGIVADRPAAIRVILKKALDECDAVLISGGTSAGSGDIVPEIVGKIGKPGVIVHGLSLKPGKPTFIGVAGGKPIFGLPGYPVSALMVFDKLVAPYLSKMAGIEVRGQIKIQARLSGKIISARGRTELVPVKLEFGKGGLKTSPLLKGSGSIVSLTSADGYIEIPRQQELVEEGEVVEVKLFGEK